MAVELVLNRPVKGKAKENHQDKMVIAMGDGLVYIQSSDPVLTNERTLWLLQQAILRITANG